MTVVELETARQNRAASESFYPDSRFEQWQEEHLKTMEETQANIERAINWRKGVYGDVV